MATKRWENATVEVEIDAKGWPVVRVWPNDGPPESLYLDPRGNPQWFEHKEDPNPIYSRARLVA